MNFKVITLLFIFLIVPKFMLAATDPNQIKKAVPAMTWQDINSLSLTVEDNQNSWKANWLITIDKEKNTISIEKDDYFHNHNLKGTIIVLAGKTMLSKGLVLKKGYEIDALDTPIIMFQLLLDILNKTIPSGPSSVTKEFTVEHTETQVPIHISTKSASAHFNAPWTVTGQLSKAVKGSIDYDLKFATSLNGGINYTLEMAGELHQKSGRALDDTMKLDGWQIYQLGPVETQRGDITSFDYGAQLIHPKASTLGKLRLELR
jgi:hypothetical protein